MRRLSNTGVLALSVAVLVLVFAASVLVPVSSTAALTPHSLPADGHTSARLVWSLDSVYGRPVPFYPWRVRADVVAGSDRLRLVGDPVRTGGLARLELAVQAIGSPGRAMVELDDGFSRRSFEVEITAASGDRDGDGMPDPVELVDDRDRRAFSAWFTAIAEAQFYAPDPRWEPIHRDCAGLIRFAYKEALRRHDRSWFEHTPYLHRAANPDVRRYHYPDVPVIGERLFRVSPGAYSERDDPQVDFSPSASARMLWEHNTVFVSLSAERARPGDLLFFHDPERHRSPMHSMILLDPEDIGERRRVVYHTGQGDDGPGEVRLVRLATLNAHRDESWHVRADNPHFLGFFRWKILEGGR